MDLSETRQSTQEGGSIRFTITFADDALHLTSTPYGLFVALEACEQSGAPGAPALPRHVLRVAAPQETHVVGVRATPMRTIQVTDAPMLVTPIQRPQPGTIAGGSAGQDYGRNGRLGPKPSTWRPPEQPLVRPFPAQPMVLPDAALYQQEVDSPRPVARLRTTEYIGLAHIASIEINPVRLTESGQLAFHPVMEVAIDYRADTGGNQGSGGWTPPNPQTIRSRAQAERLYTLATMSVVNPQDVWTFSGGYSPLQLTAVDYLIITDNQKWDEKAIRPTGSAGDLVSAFQPLVDWKTSRGLAASIVTVTDIVGGRYGDFWHDARDLQEVIRRFLQWAYVEWGIAWVLLGGTVDIVPTRLVASPVGALMPVQAQDPPPKNASYWTGSILKMNVEDDDDGWGWGWQGLSPETPLVRPDTGTLIPYDATGSASASSPGWSFSTDESYTTRSTTPTKYVVVYGPESLVNGTLQWLYFFGNMIPTDLYYASLTGPKYGLAGHHDWDLNGNGIYGQHTVAEDDSADLDGVSFHTDVSVGRAPVSDPTTASTFVRKVLTYERLRTADGIALDRTWPSRTVLASTNWGGRMWFWRGAYYHGDGQPSSLIELADAPTDLLWRLFAFVTETDIRLLPFDMSAGISGRGWYYAVGATDMTPSFTPISIETKGGRKDFISPVPTNWVVVYSGESEELAPAAYIFDRIEQDGSEADTEQLRMQMAGELPGLRVADRLYEDEIDLTPAEAAAAPVEHIATARLQAALNAGPHLVSLSGHGSWEGCCALSRGMADGLTNGPYTFIGYADSCLTNQFDRGNPFDGGTPCSEHLVTNPNGGAVAYIGNSRFSWIGLGAIFERTFFHQLTATHNLGLVFDVLRTLLHTPWPAWANRWSMFALNLMGDPEMPLWVPDPGYLHIPVPEQVVPEYVSPAVPLAVPVRLGGGGGDPGSLVEGAVVVLRQGIFTQMARTDSQGIATFRWEGIGAGPLEISASLFGAVPEQRVVQVLQVAQAPRKRPESGGWLGRVVLVLAVVAVLVLLAVLVLRH